jgi:diguanylate cyclase (GGDEF)-like protein
MVTLSLTRRERRASELDRAVELSQGGGWALRSASDAARELVRLVRDVGAPGWSWESSPASFAVDLRGGDQHPTEPVPVVLPDGHVLGTIRCPLHPTGAALDAALRALLQTTVLAVAMERRGGAAVDRAATFERQSRLDSLTGLPNRRLWDEVVAKEQARCARHGYRALVAIIDLDDLKVTNDEHGHLAGDVLLRIAGEALRRAVRDTDVVARLGGDEFAVLAVEFEDGDPRAFAARLERHLGAAGVNASVGVVLAAPGEELTRAVERADRRMYDIKRAHKGSSVSITPPAG